MTNLISPFLFRCSSKGLKSFSTPSRSLRAPSASSCAGLARNYRLSVIASPHSTRCLESPAGKRAFD